MSELLNLILGQALEIESLKKVYNNKLGSDVAVDNISMSIGSDEFLVLVGPSGCGKTSTLRCVAGLEDITEGKIRIDGEDITDTPVHKRGMAMMFQDIALYPHMSVRENIAYPLKVRNVPKEERDDRARQAAEIMQIDQHLEDYPKQMSGGQRQRTALARCIAVDPVAFLMDEPLSDLDANLKVEIRREIQRVHRKVKKPTIYVTHDQQEAMTMGDRIAVMNDGEIAQIGTPDELYERPQSAFVAKFIGTPNMNLIPSTIHNMYDSELEISISDNKINLRKIESVDTPSSDSVLVGIRPESIEITDPDKDDLAGEIQLVERISDRRQVTIETSFGEVLVTVPADKKLDVGEQVSLSFSQGRLFIFDSESKKLIARAQAKVNKKSTSKNRA